MTLVALLFIAVGVADIIRERFRRQVGPVIGAAAGAFVVTLVGLGLGVSAAWVAAIIAVMVVWVVVTALPSAGQSGYLKLALLAGATATAWAFPLSTPIDDSPLGRWYERLPHGFTETLSLDGFLLGVGAVLLLVETSNIIVRLIIAAAPRVRTSAIQTADAAAPARRSWFTRGGTATAVSPSPQVETPLKGGRILGPFERIFLFALVMAGAYAALAALVAAKGIIRFPEISKDSAVGSKAEYFLVGSFASWAVVLVVAVLAKSA